ncbi:hypothetical protein HPP92_028827 [Vanilla planifolia]|uniref:Uncharacterized protein n=1 Tax=Vanilla planifolia TaxID=51239 RepID=A0A835P4M0_VANPL|nr:hypothetical protein HPP92_028827 [Vanilla planifolia]KAG0446463.1 hypothetical protein HPP92_028816 [Vanilla planifolia]
MSSSHWWKGPPDLFVAQHRFSSLTINYPVEKLSCTHPPPTTEAPPHIRDSHEPLHAARSSAPSAENTRIRPETRSPAYKRREFLKNRRSWISSGRRLN